MIFEKLLRYFVPDPPVTKLIPLDIKLKAFGEMIAWAEIGPYLLAASDNGYNVLVGSTLRYPLLFYSYDDHPKIYNPQYNSTAAGRYQIIKSTWSCVKNILKLPDFSPESQDKAMRYLVEKRGANALLEMDDINSAIVACSKEWASLAGSTSGQHQFDLETLRNIYLGKLTFFTK